MTLYAEDPKDSKKKKKLELTNAKVVDTKSTHQNQMHFLYTNNKQSQREIFKKYHLQ